MMIWVFPVSISILSSLSIISILLSSFNTGTSMMANMKSTVDKEIEKYDRGVALLPEPRIRRLKKFNSRKYYCSSLIIFATTLFFFISITILISSQPVLKSDIRIVISPTQIEVVDYKDFFEYKQNTLSKCGRLLTSDKGVLLSTRASSSQYDVVAVWTVIIGVVLSWLLLGSIIASFYTFIRLSCIYINLYPKS